MINFSDLFFYQENNPLMFTSLVFWLFFALILAGYSMVYKKNTVRHFYLLLISFFFYYKSSGFYFGLLVFSTLVDYLIAFRAYNASKKITRNGWVALSLLINLGLLGYFKYAYMFTDVINGFFGTHYVTVNYFAQWANMFAGAKFNVSEILLPVGISFYTFQTISYTIDVSKKKIAPLKNVFDFAFFVSFFPQLVAGPIVRAAQFIPQLYQKYSLTREQFGHAMFLICNGLVKKMIISDYISINFVDRVFENYTSYSGFEILTAVYGYAIQIYCDFSGYTDIAIGIALLLGFRLPINFYSPYKATSITDFWRRWHISLSTWLRDYLYIGLGGNRKGKIRTSINLMITMLLGGLWHGANVKFIIWGGIHGVGLIINKLWAKVNPIKRVNGFVRFLQIALTFHLICLTWIFFRADSYTIAMEMIYRIFTTFQPLLIMDVIAGYRWIFAIIAVGYIVHWLPEKFKETYRGIFIKSPIYLQSLYVIILFFILYQAHSSEIQPFIYFRF